MIPRMKSREALVTGVGVVNAIASDFEAFVEAMREGRCGQRPDRQLRHRRPAQPARLRGGGFRPAPRLRTPGRKKDGAELRARACRLRPGRGHGGDRSPRRGADERRGRHGLHPGRIRGRIPVLSRRPGRPPPPLPATGPLDARAGLPPVHRIGLPRPQPGVLDRMHVVQPRSGGRPRPAARGQGRRGHRRGLRHDVPGVLLGLQRDAQRHPRRLPPVRSQPRRPRPR